MKRPVAERDRLDRENANLLDVYGEPWLASQMRSCLTGRLVDRENRRNGSKAPPHARCRRTCCEGCRAVLNEKLGQRTCHRWKGIQSGSEAAMSCSIVTVVLGRCGALIEVDHVIRRTRACIRNKRRSWKWASATGDGIVEVDGIEAADITRVLPGRWNALQDIPQHGRQTGFLFCPCLHLALHHPHLTRDEVRVALQEMWPGRNVVDVRPMNSNDVGDEAGGFVSYAAKHAQVTSLAHEVKPWNPSARIAYWSWLCGRNSGIRPLRIEFKPARVRDNT